MSEVNEVGLTTARARAVASSDGSTLDEDGRHLLQRRTANFGFVLLCCSGGFLTYRFVSVLVTNHYDQVDGSFLAHAVGVVVFAAMWLLTRARRRSGAFLRRLESWGFVLGCSAYAAMSPGIPVWVRPEMIVVLAMTLTAFARAAYIPSSGRRTLLYCVLAGIPMLVITFLSLQKGFSSPDWVGVPPHLADVTPVEHALGRTSFAAAWWTSATAIATLASHAIYGLRRDIRQVRRLGRYELGERLGAGGMGEVYRARHALLERPTAVKLLPIASSLSRSTQFEREVQLTAQLSHPNTVTVFDYGRTADGVFYYAMELIDGLTLEQLVTEEGPMSAARTVHLVRQAASALVEAHGVGLIHRDIKPGNIMLTLPHTHGGVHEQAKVVDFGLARDVRAVDIEGSGVDTLRGTPLYMAPESIRTPADIDGRSDLYALGATAYYMLTGKPVFGGTTVIEVCSQHLYEPPDDTALHDHRVPPALRDIVMRCLAKNPDDRPKDALELVRALDALPEAHSWTARDARTWWMDHRGAQASSPRSSERPAPQLRTIDVCVTPAS